MIKNTKKIYVAGHNGMVGSSILRNLKTHFQSYEIITESKDKLDLQDEIATHEFVKKTKPDIVIIAAAKVGGIHANNSYPVDFLFNNLAIQNNLIKGSFLAGVEKLIFLGSSCIYPKDAPQPISEESLLAGYLEKTNEPYALAKISGIKMCESFNRQYQTDYRSLMPTNLYGFGDNYHPLNSHVIPGLIRRFHDCKINNSNTVNVWGTGKPRREFLFVDDLANAIGHILKIEKSKFFEDIDPMCSHVNIGSGYDITIKNLAFLISKIVGFKGNIQFDSSKPEGTMRKLMNSNKVNNLGWKPITELEDGLKLTYKNFLSLC